MKKVLEYLKSGLFGALIAIGGSALVLLICYMFKHVGNYLVSIHPALGILSVVGFFGFVFGVALSLPQKKDCN